MRALLVLAVSLSLAACTTRRPGEDGGAPDAPFEPGLSLSPAELELVSVDGSLPEVTFTAFLTGGDGTRREVTPGSWSSGEPRVGDVDAGTFTVTGRAGGAVEVVARYVDPAAGPLAATAMVRVRVELTVPPDPSIPGPVVERLRTLPDTDADPLASATIEYPLDGASMPNNVVAPVVQWHPRDRAGDGFRLVLETPYAVVRAFAYDDGRRFRSSIAIDPAVWRVVADSARGETVSMRVDRLPPGADVLARGAPISIELAEDGVFGTLYYWQVHTDPQSSDVLRLDATTGVRESVLAPEAGACVGCHSLSHDGRRLAATTDMRGLPWTTPIVDAASATAPPPDLVELSTYHFLAFSPDGDRALASHAASDEATSDSRLVLLDTTSGDRLPALGLPEGIAGYPAWSPDGAFVAWMAGGGDGTRGTTAPTRIEVAAVETGDAFGAATVVHEGSSLEDTLEGGVTDARPSWSPDGRFLAFAHGTSSVSAVDIGATAPTSSLYLVPREGGAPIRLTRGMGREGPVDAFWPVFSPFVTEARDGRTLYWLAFYSRADYGNDREGTAGTDRRQLWVMAIDPARAAAGEDPSSPPYWLPGQDTQADDIAALWAPRACRLRGEGCSASSECCTGQCAAADPSLPDVLTCGEPVACRGEGESCERASDCCEGVCNLGVCGYEPPF